MVHATLLGQDCIQHPKSLPHGVEIGHRFEQACKFADNQLIAACTGLDYSSLIKAITSPGYSQRMWTLALGVVEEMSLCTLCTMSTACLVYSTYKGWCEDFTWNKGTN